MLNHNCIKLNCVVITLGGHFTNMYFEMDWETKWECSGGGNNLQRPLYLSRKQGKPNRSRASVSMVWACEPFFFKHVCVYLHACAIAHRWRGGEELFSSPPCGPGIRLGSKQLTHWAVSPAKSVQILEAVMRGVLFFLSVWYNGTF